MKTLHIEKFESNGHTEYLLKHVTTTLAVVVPESSGWSVHAVRTKRDITGQFKSTSIEDLLDELKNTDPETFLDIGENVYYIQLLSDIDGTYYLSKDSVKGVSYQCADSLCSALFMTKDEAEVMLVKINFNKDKVHFKFKCENFMWASVKRLQNDFPEVRQLAA